MDIFLDGIQKMTEEMVTEQSVTAAFIMDRRGAVVAHSDPGEIGKNYLVGGTDAEKAMAIRVLDGQDERSSTKTARSREIVFAEKINDDWYAVLLLNRSTLLDSIRHIKLALVLILILAVSGWYAISFSIHRKYREAEQLSREVNAVADIYEAMTLIDLKTGQMTLLRSNPTLERLLEGDLTYFSGRILQMAGKVASDQSRDLLVQFMDPTTYDERMRNVNSISHDFKDSEGRWVRVQLIVVDRDSGGRLRHIIWALESIDEEHRQRENLRRLAETDPLSKVRNRRSGETGIQSKLAEGIKGIFILVDVDHFKSINDSYGHKAGDLVIVSIADRLRSMFRENDIVFRLGGDEFAVFVSDVEDRDTAQRIVKRVEEEISRIVIPELQGSRIGISVGAALYPSDEAGSYDALYQKADQQMYENKRLKRASR